MNNGPNWILNYNGEITYNSPSLAHWALNQFCIAGPCSGTLTHGTSGLGNVLWQFNGYFWAIGSNQLSQDYCQPTNMVFSGVCP
jgi:hypothetical protein